MSTFSPGDHAQKKLVPQGNCEFKTVVKFYRFVLARFRYFIPPHPLINDNNIKRLVFTNFSQGFS